MLALVALPFWLGACSDGASAPSGPGADGDDGERPLNILIEGNIATDLAAPVQLTATARYADGREVDVTAEAIWTAADPTSVSIEGGLVTALEQPSSTDITVTYAGVSETGPFYVVRLPYRGMQPAVIQESAIEGAGSTGQLRAIADFFDRGEIDVTHQSRWWSFDESVATVTDDGVVTGVSVGTTSIMCTYRGYTFGIGIEVGDPPQMFDVQVNPQIFYTSGAWTCDSATNFDGRDGEFAIQINVITPDGERHLLLETLNYPDPDHVIEADSGDDVSMSNSHPSLTGPGVMWFRLSEIQSLQVELRVTEWDLFFEDFGDDVPDSDMDDEVVVRTHYGSDGFDHGDHAVTISGGQGGCEVTMEYIVNAQ
jgi:hypothetical protein